LAAAISASLQGMVATSPGGGGVCCAGAPMRPGFRSGKGGASVWVAAAVGSNPASKISMASKRRFIVERARGCRQMREEPNVLSFSLLK
jgi:hypothetical protein